MRRRRHRGRRGLGGLSGSSKQHAHSGGVDLREAEKLVAAARVSFTCSSRVLLATRAISSARAAYENLRWVDRRVIRASERSKLTKYADELEHDAIKLVRSCMRHGSGDAPR